MEFKFPTLKIRQIRELARSINEYQARRAFKIEESVKLLLDERHNRGFVPQYQCLVCFFKRNLKRVRKHYLQRLEALTRRDNCRLRIEGSSPGEIPRMIKMLM